jgi:AraC-like DNA-binding protein
MIPISSTIRGAVGACLRPAGLRLLLQGGAGNLTDSPLIALEDLLGAEGRQLLEHMIEQPSADERMQVLRQFLLARVSRVVPPHPAVRRAIDLIVHHHGEISTERLAEACGCTSRTLRAATAAETGLPPKHLARVARIRRALELLNERHVPLSTAAVAAAFSDHAHMSREFRELIGAAPSDLSQRLRSSAVPTFTTERKLTSTGLLVMPRDGSDP